MSGFRIESFATARRRRLQLKQRLLRVGTPAAAALAEKLTGCRGAAPCGSAACSSCLRRFRLRLIAEAEPFLDGCDVVRLSWVPPGGAIAVDDLAEFDLELFGKKCTRALQRCVPSDAIVIGGIDVALNVFANGDPSWGFHIYTIIAVERDHTGRGVESLKEQLRRLPTDPDAPRPLSLRTVELDSDLKRPISYALKSEFYRRSGYWYVRRNNGRQARNTRQLALPSAAAVQLFLSLDRFPIGTRLLLVGLRRHGTVGKFKLRPTSPLVVTPTSSRA